MPKSSSKASKAKGTKAKKKTAGYKKAKSKKKPVKKPAKTIKKAVKPRKKPTRKKRTAKDRLTMIDELVLELQSDDEQVSLGAIGHLGRIDDSSATSHLIGCLTDSRYMVRIYAAAQLGERRDKKAVNPLIDALNDESLFVRQAFARALVNIGGSKAQKAVKKAEVAGFLMDELPEGRRLDG